MGYSPQTVEYGGGEAGAISHYRLDFQRDGNHHWYIWRHCPPGGPNQKAVAMLIDLNNVLVPDHEIEKMVFGFVVPSASIGCIAFANCHMHNQRDIKRKLKSGNVELYSRTAFFTDIKQAQRWLETQCAR